jgi:S1-C subfamily serine protease
MSERQLIETIDLYLRGELPAKEYQDFKEKIDNDKALEAKVREQSKLMEKLQEYGKRKTLKDKLNNFHAELEVIPVVKNKRRFLNRNFNNKYFAIAASLSGLLLLTASFYLGFLSSTGKSSTSQYQALRRDMKEIEATQHKIIRDLQANQSTPTIAPAHFSGTGFMVSTKGYIVTSYHLIKDADSIFVENEIIGRIKVEKVSIDTKLDIAILKIEETKSEVLGRIPFTLKKSDASLGEKVFTLGFPREDIVYGEGSISSASGYKGDTLAYQVSIPVNPGNSGGPLLDDQGNLIGVISGKHTGAEASNFAVKAEYIYAFLNSDKENKIVASGKNSVAYLKRSEQIKKIKPFIFNVRVY